MRLARVDRADIPDLWPTIAPLLEIALERAPSELTINTLLTRVMEGRVTIYVIYDEGNSVAVFAAGMQPDGAAEIFVLAGDRVNDWVVEAADQFSRLVGMMGASVLRMGGRKGWLKPLLAAGFVFVGWEDDRVLMERTLH